LVSPILVRPVREQLEHDKLIRLLQIRFRRRFDAEANPGEQQSAGVRAGSGSLYPDLLLFSQDRSRRLQAIVEVETGESVNHLEALAQWAPFGRLRVDFHLYVPAHMVDVARRLCEDNKVAVTEIWSYHLVGDQFRFTLMHRVREPAPPPRPVRRKPAPGAARRKTAPPAKRAASRSAKGSAATKSLRKVRPQKRR
jgi:hypothetical protein